MIYLQEFIYDKKSALSYAKRWAFSRNPRYYNFNNIGGDCTNFISQCLYAGCKTMNFTPIYGWYYENLNNRTPSWTGVEYLFTFLVNNLTIGPFGIISNINSIEIGDIIQLGDKNNKFYHSLFVTGIKESSLRKLNDIFIATHSDDAFMRPLSTYFFDNIRFLHILGYRK